MVKGPPRRPGELAVVCDTMLQGLGRYLRCCGVDTVMLQNGEEHMKAVEVIKFLYVLFHSLFLHGKFEHH